MSAPIPAQQPEGRKFSIMDVVEDTPTAEPLSEPTQSRMATPSRSDVAGEYKRLKLLDAIASGEAFDKNDGYTSMNQGTKDDKIIGSKDSAKHILGDRDLTDLTLRELLEFQKLPNGHKNRIFAAGRYQIIPTTMEYAIDRSGLSLDDKFSPENQDKLALTLAIKARPKLAKFLSGESNDIDSAMLDLAKEWASFPVPSGEKAGESYYGDGNSARHSVEETRKILLEAREELSKQG